MYVMYYVVYMYVMYVYIFFRFKTQVHWEQLLSGSMTHLILPRSSLEHGSLTQWQQPPLDQLAYRRTNQATDPWTSKSILHSLWVGDDLDTNDLGEVRDVYLTLGYYHILMCFPVPERHN